MTQQDQPSEISIVHEYEILYSDRIKQKDKKWNDGFLKFYEFNSKLEILNDSKILIGADFIRDKQIPYILDTLLKDDNEFVLPGGKFIIQIQGFLQTSERDISKAFTKRSSTQVESQQQQRRQPTKLISPPTRIIKAGSGRTNGQSLKASRSLKLSQPLIRTSAPALGIRKKTIKHKNGAQVLPKQSEPSQAANSSIITKTSGESLKPNKIIRSAANTSHFTTTNSTQSKIRQLLISKDRRSNSRPLPRILPMTSTHFEYMHTPREETEAMSFQKPRNRIGWDDVADDEGIDDYDEEDHEVEEEEEYDVHIKEEKKFVDSGTKLEDADIIYDFSDFEEDQNFMEMIQQKRQQDFEKAAKMDDLEEWD
ncbi:uncharacterized protein J8A68_005002 [[Candida] subhashii]|uniref:5'-3' DNA helicase ZGRF1-like N-terminal domain-containing protein n=1 Tax=[Candida] subhashii TaxID=561895 RepID=A0A8J5Q497_9ASCO|nr:uncharacterized protein J8A68_005002 [[Candida] subhashii]KAG7661424.1 hypothetical protein J8A68_005002 [[Candida] subhashii]